jgi:hypothetical protein
MSKGGNAYTPAFLITASGVLLLLQAFMSSPFGKDLGDNPKAPVKAGKE